MDFSVESGNEIAKDVEKYESTYKTMIFIAASVAVLLMLATFIDYIFYLLYGRGIKEIRAMIDSLESNEA